jgi:hypothetical protein
MPPDFNLRPPRPGAKRPQEKTIQEAARNLLIKGTVSSRNTPAQSRFSDGETALLKRAGAANPNPAIRRQINRESSILATENDNFADRLLFWQDNALPGSLVDARAEQKRLRENAGLGDAPTQGRTPTIVRKPKGWLQGIF